MSGNTPKVIHLSERRRADGAVLHSVIRDHETALRRFLRARLANHPDYEDLVQETFLRLARLTNLDEKFSQGQACTRSYLFSVATNLIRDMHKRDAIRREANLQDVEENILQDERPSSEAVLASRQELHSIKKVIMGLEANCRRAFVLSRVRNLSYREIAEEMKISVSMVEKHVMQALAEMRRKTGPR